MNLEPRNLRTLWNPWIAFSLILSASCNSPASPDSSGGSGAAAANCRLIPSAGTFTLTTHFSTQSAVSTAPIRCSYDRTANVLTCRPTTPNFQCSATYSATYRNIDDFIEEGRSVGKLHAMTQTGLGLGDVCSDGDTATYTYDTQHRLVSSQAGSSRVTYSNWDAQGRPRTSVQTSGGPADCPMTSDMAYDDSARTLRVTGRTSTACPSPTTVNGALTLGPDFVDRTFNTTTTPSFGTVRIDTTLTGSTTESVCR